MSWILSFVIIAFAIYLIYNTIAIKLFGIPKSLSDTFYLYQEKQNWMKFFFPIMMFLMAGLLMPAWLEITAFSMLQFLAFLTAAGIMFTGAAPAFKSNKLTNAVHSASAICSAIFALLWIIFVSKFWWIIIFWLVLILITSLLTKTLKKSYIYWLETVAFLSTFSSILLFYLI